jgi:hypothetical protein
MRSVALVESPAQLLNVVEWAYRTKAGVDDLLVVVLAPSNERSRLQLKAMSALAREAGLVVSWHEPRQGGAAAARTVRSLAAELAHVERLIVGDPFSGVIQVVLSVSGAAEVVIVDDGTATMQFAQQWVAGEHLARWHEVAEPGHRQQVARFARDQIAASVRRRIGPGSGCRMSVFSCLPVELGRVPVVRNSFAWTRHRFGPPTIKETADLVGTSLVETGVVELEAYVNGVSNLAGQLGVDRYFAHRKESERKLDRIAALGLEIVRPELPLEIAARIGVIGSRVISFPSTVVHTLPLVLADTSSKLVVCDIAGNWLMPDAAARSGQFLSTVTATARTRFGLAAVAC